MIYTQQDVQDNLGLVYMTARKMRYLCDRGLLDFEDLISEGTLGLIHALDRFDPDRGLRFSSYAVKCIWGFILRGHRNLYREFWKAQNSCYDVPTFTISIFRKDLTKDEKIRYVAGLDDHGVNAEDIIGNANLSMIAKRLLAVSMTERERKIVVERFGLDGKGKRTLEEIGRELGLSRERVRRLQARVLKRAQEVFLPQIREIREEMDA